MSIFQSTVAITILMMVSFNSIELMNILRTRDELTYNFYYLTQIQLNAKTGIKPQLRKKILSKNRPEFITFIQNDSKVHFSYQNQKQVISFNDRTIKTSRIK